MYTMPEDLIIMFGNELLHGISPVMAIKILLLLNMSLTAGKSSYMKGPRARAPEVVFFVV